MPDNPSRAGIATAPPELTPRPARTRRDESCADDLAGTAALLASQRPIEAHGVIGDMRCAALVADDGCVDFFCWPEIDSPSVFVSLLDGHRAGVFELAPELKNARRMQIYVPDTNILQTRWLAHEAVVEVTDMLPIHPPERESRLVRTVRAVNGTMTIRMRCAVRHDYARADTRASAEGQDVRFDAPGFPAMRLAADVDLTIEDDAACASFVLKEGESAQFVLGGEDDELVARDVADNGEAQTQAFWRRWIRTSNYRGRWRHMVERSALALKLLTSRKNGAIAAAVTFGLPESPGYERNWDYRYTWIRDASFTIYAFMRLGFTEEAQAFMDWSMQRISNERQGADVLRIMYTMEGEAKIEESELDHLIGHMGSRPVRVGNDAYGQEQHDIYGELLDGVYLSNKYGQSISHQDWEHVVAIVEQACRVWNTPDVGIWEMRGEQQHFLHSRLMCWVAVDRAIRLAQKRSLPAPFARWNDVRAAIHEDIWTHFWNEEEGHFVQREGSTALDGSLLLMPLVRFISATDPCWLSTLDAIGRSLVRDGMVKRYHLHETPCDGLKGEEGAFGACSFWHVECLARAGRLDDARIEFEKLLSYANPVGLFAEEFDTRGHHLGNTPQALTHLAMISAATFLDRKLEGTPTTWQP